MLIREMADDRFRVCRFAISRAALYFHFARICTLRLPVTIFQDGDVVVAGAGPSKGEAD